MFLKHQVLLVVMVSKFVLFDGDRPLDWLDRGGVGGGCGRFLLVLGPAQRLFHGEMKLLLLLFHRLLHQLGGDQCWVGTRGGE